MQRIVLIEPEPVTADHFGLADDLHAAALRAQDSMRAFAQSRTHRSPAKDNRAQTVRPECGVFFEFRAYGFDGVRCATPEAGDLFTVDCLRTLSRIEASSKDQPAACDDGVVHDAVADVSRWLDGGALVVVTGVATPAVVAADRTILVPETAATAPPVSS